MTISFINDSNDTARWKAIFEKALGDVFNNVQYGETDVVFNVVSPTPTLGKIDILLFINIERRDKNFYLTTDRMYLHNLVIGIKKYEFDDVIDADNNYFFNEEGSWSYSDEIEAEGRALDSFFYKIHPDIKYFKSAIFYYVNAPHCSKSFTNEFVLFNSPMRMSALLASACRRCQTKKYNGAWSMLLTQGYDMHRLINTFIEEAEAKTRQGILTKKKMNAIVKDSAIINRILNVMGSRLCIIKGNPGAGKTLALMRIAYKTVCKEYDKEGENRSHNVRILTYNNMLVYDIKNTLKSMGAFSPTNLSVQTLHKFFFDMFKKTPAVWEKYSGNMIERINDLLDTCNERIEVINAKLIESYYNLNKKETSPYLQIETYENKQNAGKGREDYQYVIAYSDRKEADMYFQFLKLNRRWETLSLPNDLDKMKENYVLEKKKNAIEAFLHNAFTSDYEAILKDMYFLFKDPVKFKEDHKLNSKRDFFEFIFTTDIQTETIDDYINNPDEVIKRKVKWSHAILVDEAQDCSIFEKALLYETRGSENVVIAHGGKDQLIRQAKGTDWSQYFGHKLLVENFNLRGTNWRQKANIITFLNAFAKHHNLESKGLTIPKETEGYGHVIIDLRQIGEGKLALDKIASLRNQGKAYGCSDYENLMVLLPRKGYTHSIQNDLNSQTRLLQASIDVTDTISFSTKIERCLKDFGHKDFEGTEDLRICDCTISSKGDLNPGQSDTRFLYYDSCRGLESWNVMCINIDDFYYEKRESPDAKQYASESVGFIAEDKSLFQSHYAITWCFMAFTRPMDTLYITLRNTDSEFSKELLEIAKSCGDTVEILRE
jgi:hypothetical protein